MTTKSAKDNQEYLTPLDMEKQEHLSKERLDKLVATIQASQSTTDPMWKDRPTANFIDLMNWVESNFANTYLGNAKREKFVHNRVIIDGQFLQFCEEKKVKITCLYKDSLISWKTENELEKFFAQGIFLIETKDTKFLHSALFHKGNQNEDEISFFIICSNSNYEGYVKLRNDFDTWVSERDRGNLHIRVIGGEDIYYTKDHTWDDLFMPNELKQEIKSLVENFLASKEFYAKNKIPWKRGLIFYGVPGCGKSSLIRTIISMYDFKPVCLAAGATNDDVQEAFSYAESQSPALLFFEDLDSLLDRIDVSAFLNLMDGIEAKNGLFVIATANEIRKLKTNITDRPSRFDRKFEISAPTSEMAYIYLKKWFGSLITTKKCRELAKLTTKHHFSYAYLKETYISSMFEALSNNRKVPTEKDITVALNRIIKDKIMLNSGAVNMDKYL